MKRTQLKRKTPLRSNVPLKRSTKPLVTRKPMRKVSVKQSKRLANYSVTKAIYLASHPNCERCGAQAGHLHHKHGRGIYLDNPDFYCALCENCHSAVHENPNQARKDGWIID